MVGALKAWAVVLFLFLAGCVGNDVDSTPAKTETSSSVAAGTGQGGIRVIVTTDDLAPIEAVDVLLRDTGQAAQTDAAGEATFSRLEPGKYVVVAAKPGFTPVQEAGREVNVIHAEVATVRMQMRPIEIANESSIYQKTLPLQGFMSCSFAYYNGYTSYCGRGVTLTNGQTVGDPNDKTLHPWMVDSDRIRTIVMEATWTPSQETLGKEMFLRTSATWRCTGANGQTCQADDTFVAKGGPTPVKDREDETGEKSITKRIAKYNQGKYPHQVFTDSRAYCESPCQLTLMVNQRYTVWVAAFYGAEAEPGYTSLPS